MSFTPVIFLLCLARYVSLSDIFIENIMDQLTNHRFRKPSLFYYGYNHNSSVFSNYLLLFSYCSVALLIKNFFKPQEENHLQLGRERVFINSEGVLSINLSVFSWLSVFHKVCEQPLVNAEFENLFDLVYQNHIFILKIVRHTIKLQSQLNFIAIKDAVCYLILAVKCLFQS